MRNLTTYLLSSLLIIGTACGGSGNSGNNEDAEKEKDTASSMNKESNSKDKAMEEKDEKEAMMKNGLKVYPIETKNFGDAQLQLSSPEGMELEAGKQKFNFDVKNYNLKQGTPDAGKHDLAESAKGQHIHFIVNNGPYMAKYDNSFEVKMDDGYHTVLAFLSRSYHESLKQKEAFIVKQFNVGEPDGEKADLSKPHIFYSRPKGTYKGKDFKKLLLDFYPVNATLGEDRHKVRATVNGTSFTFTEWKPYVIEGLKAGELTVKLELLDSNGELVDSKFNEVTRKVTLKEGDKKMSSDDSKSGSSEKSS